MKYIIIIFCYAFTQFTAHSVEIDYQLEFGLVLKDTNGEAIGFKKTTAIPIDTAGENSLYGIVISKDSEENFTVGSVHILPKEHKEINKIMGKVMVINGKGAVFMKTQSNDIPGDYAIEVYINGILFKTIEYKLLATT